MGADNRKCIIRRSTTLVLEPRLVSIERVGATVRPLYDFWNLQLVNEENAGVRTKDGRPQMNDPIANEMPET
jgi:hypothetical protein